MEIILSPSGQKIRNANVNEYGYIPVYVLQSSPDKPPYAGGGMRGGNGGRDRSVRDTVTVVTVTPPTTPPPPPPTPSPTSVRSHYPTPNILQGFKVGFKIVQINGDT